MSAVIARPLTVVLCAVLVVAGCTSADDNPSGPQATAPTTEAPETTTSPRAECRNVVDDAQALLTEVGGLATRDATVDDVRTAASTLATSLDDAKTALGPEARADLDRAGTALQRIQDALRAQPVNPAELRSAANDLVAALGDAAAVCTGGSATETGTTTS